MFCMAVLIDQILQDLPNEREYKKGIFKNKLFSKA